VLVLVQLWAGAKKRARSDTRKKSLKDFDPTNRHHVEGMLVFIKKEAAHLSLQARPYVWYLTFSAGWGNHFGALELAQMFPAERLLYRDCELVVV